MLRLIVLALILANGGYYAWSHGLLAAYGFAPTSQSEPQRMEQQINPESLRILTPAELRQIENGQPLAPQSAAFSSTPSSTPSNILTSALTGTTTPQSTPPLTTATSVVAANTPSAPGCLQVGLFNEEQTVVLKERLVSVMPPGSWQLEPVLEPARWLVYMGKYNSAESVEKKKSELRGLGVSFTPLNNPSLEPGLSIGNFSTQAAANAELARIAKKGVKTAKVLQDRTEQRGQRLKLPTVDAALRSQLDTLKPQLAGKAFQACV